MIRGVAVSHVTAASGRRVVVVLNVATEPGKAAEVAAAIVRPQVKTALAVGMDDALRALVATTDAPARGDR